LVSFVTVWAASQQGDGGNSVGSCSRLSAITKKLHNIVAVQGPANDSSTDSGATHADKQLLLPLLLLLRSHRLDLAPPLCQEQGLCKDNQQ
jgi:hypothetical protein